MPCERLPVVAAAVARENEEQAREDCRPTGHEASACQVVACGTFGVLLISSLGTSRVSLVATCGAAADALWIE